MNTSSMKISLSLKMNWRSSKEPSVKKGTLLGEHPLGIKFERTKFNYFLTYYKDLNSLPGASRTDMTLVVAIWDDNCLRVFYPTNSAYLPKGTIKIAQVFFFANYSEVVSSMSIMYCKFWDPLAIRLNLTIWPSLIYLTELVIATIFCSSSILLQAYATVFSVYFCLLRRIS